jgi:hypothetical protein
LATGLKKDEKIDKKAEKAASVADITARLKATSTAPRCEGGRLRAAQRRADRADRDAVRGR